MLYPAQRPLLMVYSGVGQLLSKVLGAFNTCWVHLNKSLGCTSSFCGIKIVPKQQIAFSASGGAAALAGSS